MDAVLLARVAAVAAWVVVGPMFVLAVLALSGLVGLTARLGLEWCITLLVLAFAGCPIEKAVAKVLYAALTARLLFKATATALLGLAVVLSPVGFWGTVVLCYLLMHALVADINTARSRTYAAVFTVEGSK
jgi:hypothetical protein